MSDLRRDGSGALVSTPRLVLVVLTVFVVHAALLSHASVLGVRPETMLLLSVVVGIDLGPEAGVRVGLLSGVLADVLTDAPIGVWALLCSVLGFTVGFVRDRAFAGSRSSLPPMFVVAATVSGVLAYSLLGSVVGGLTLPEPRRLPALIVVPSLMNIALLGPLRWTVVRVVRLGERT